MSKPYYNCRGVDKQFHYPEGKSFFPLELCSKFYKGVKIGAPTGHDKPHHP